MNQMGKLFKIFDKRGSKHKDQFFPKEHWFVVETTLNDGRPITGSINRGYKNYNHKQLFSYCLRIMIALDEKQIFENGLPNQDEFKIAVKFENELVNKICEMTTAHYIGRLFYDGLVDSYIYLEEPETIHNFLTKEVNEPNLLREFAYEIKDDPIWDMVQAFLE